MVPGEDPGQDRGEDPREDPGEDPGCPWRGSSGGIPGKILRRIPGRIPAVPGENPGEDPKEDPGEDPISPWGGSQQSLGTPVALSCPFSLGRYAKLRFKQYFKMKPVVAALQVPK